MSDRTKTVECDKHGKGAATFICRHLAFGVRCGYHCSTDDPDDPWPDAWCSGCDEVLEREGGAWNDASEEFAGVSLACSGCYEDHKARNETLSGPLRDRGELPEDVWAAFLHDAVHATQRRQDEAIARWHFTSHAKWRRDGSLFRFLDPELPDLVCEAVVVGSWSKNTETWLWSWANDHLSPEDRGDIGRLHYFGHARNVEELREPHWPAEEAAGWEMAAIASEFLGADAVYRAPMDHLGLFLLLRNIRHASDVAQ